MEMPDVMELLDYWREFPPTHVLLRAYVGYEPKKRMSAGDSVEAMKILAPQGKKRKMSTAPKHLQAAAEQLKAEFGANRKAK